MILHIIEIEEFWIWRRFRTPNNLPRTHERALTRNGFYTWLEEIASESNTIQAQEDIMSARVMVSNIRAKLYINLRWLFANISGLMCSFELASFVVLDVISLLHWIATGSSRKSM